MYDMLRSSEIRKTDQWEKSQSEIPILVVTAADLNEKDLERLRGGVENIIQKSEMTRDQIVQEVSALITSNSGTG